MVVMLKPKTPTAAPKVADGIYPATLTKVTSFSNVYGQRIGFEIDVAKCDAAGLHRLDQPPLLPADAGIADRAARVVPDG